MLQRMLYCNNVNYLVSRNLDHPNHDDDDDKRRKSFKQFDYQRRLQEPLLNNLTSHKRFNLFDTLLISYQLRLAGSCNVEKSSFCICCKLYVGVLCN